MNLRVFAAVLAAGAAFSSAAAAAVVDYSATIDLDPSMVSSTGRLTVPLPGGPIPLSVGDTLQGTISFANNGRITVFNGSIPTDREWIIGVFGPDLFTTAESVGTFSLLGVQGDYLLPDIIVSTGFGGAVGFSKVANFTNSSFSFSGVSFSLTYVDDPDDPQTFPFTSHVTPRSLDFPFERASISEGGGVPEPAVWALLLLGFGATGHRLRRRVARWA
jgi:hypothetical protein